MLKRKKIKILLVISFVINYLPLFGEVLEVGSGQTYTTIQSALNFASPYDTVNVHAGTYNEELITINDNGIYLRSNPGDTAILVGRINVGSKDSVTIDGLEIKEWTGGTNKRGINGERSDYLTIKNCIVHDGAQGIRTRNSVGVTIQENHVYNNSNTGIIVVSAHSPDNTYKNGTLIKENYVHDNFNDGMDLMGQYIIIEGNLICDNIDSNYAEVHADGIKLLDSSNDGYEAVQHCIIRYNRIRNHGQNIDVEGIPGGVLTSDIHIFGNIVYMDTGTVHGAVLDEVNSKAIGVIQAAEYVYIYNNILGRSMNCIRVGDYNTDGTIYIENNIIINDRNTSCGITILDTSDIAALDYNHYNCTDNVINWGGNRYTNLSNFKTDHPSYEVNGNEGDPYLIDYDNRDFTLTDSSACIDSGINLGHDYDDTLDPNTSWPYSILILDQNNYGSGWEIGAYVFDGPPILSPPEEPENLRISPGDQIRPR